MVVMEYIEGETLEGDGASDAVREAVLKAVQHLHANGLVHGDIRHPNLILMDGMGDEGSRVKILDFDWAGQEGKARYPYRLSPGLWTEGVSDNGLILAAHDLEMVERL
jgi:serine/threonine protein kinase